MKKASVLDVEDEKPRDGLISPKANRNRQYHASKSSVRASEEFKFHHNLLTQLLQLPCNGNTPRPAHEFPSMGGTSRHLDGVSDRMDLCKVQEKFDRDEYIRKESIRNYKYYFDESACAIDIRLVLSNYMLRKQSSDPLYDSAKSLCVHINQLILERENRIAKQHEESERVAQAETIQIDVDTWSAEFPEVPIEVTERGAGWKRQRKEGQETRKSRRKQPECLDKEWEAILKEEETKVKSDEVEAANNRVHKLEQEYKERESRLNANVVRLEREATEAANRHRVELEKKDKEWGAKLQQSVAQEQKKAEELARLKGLEFETERRELSNIVTANLAWAKKYASDARERRNVILKRSELLFRRLIAAELMLIEKVDSQHKADLEQKDRDWESRLKQETQRVKDDAARVLEKTKEKMAEKQQQIHEALQRQQRWRFQAEQRERKLLAEKKVLEESLNKALARESERNREANVKAQNIIVEGRRNAKEWEAKISRLVEGLQKQGDEVLNDRQKELQRREEEWMKKTT